MKSAGFYYMNKDSDTNYGDYFIKTYTEVASGEEVQGNVWNSQLFFFRAAKALDQLFTRDSIFDIRFLALIYFFLYVPALYLIIRQSCERVKTFSEGALIAGVGLIIFSDVGYMTYFNSFYPEAIWFLAILYCVGGYMSFQKKRSGYKDLSALVLIFDIGKRTGQFQTTMCGDGVYSSYIGYSSGNGPQKFYLGRSLHSGAF